ncbi:MAG TPA: cupin domain-containing protein [Spirochaetota bacterium]|nr:cupin domain-containing protein [Spirochaetota bacterium]HQO01490.1 cupin domain-containing protein [Spirochaetota bacterium]HQP49583.1 cupin domain-containing protein [Spirochaetota bacterium]
MGKNPSASMPEGIFRPDGIIEYQEGAVVSRTLVNTVSGTVTVFAFDADQGLSEHTAPFDALVHVLEGAADVRIGGVSHVLEAGECIMMPAGVPHALKAVERFKMQLTMIKEKEGHNA